jgi:cell cycle checkpoint protein
MSSQESSLSAEQQQMKRKKRRRRNNTNRGPPSRLDWMGGGFGLGGGRESSRRSDDKIVTQSAAPENDSGDDETLLTPRADNTSAIDLTGSDDDGRDNIKNGNKKENKWTCQRCTLQNPQSASVCGACDARRESTRNNNTKKENYHIDGDNSDDSEFPAVTMKSRKNNGSSRSSSSTIRNNNKVPTLNSQKSQPRKRSTSSSSRNSKKSSRAASAVSAQKKQSQSQSKEMWTDKHAPKCTKDLCVAPKKIDEVKKWLISHTNCRQTKRESSVQSKTINEQDLDPWEIPDEWETDACAPEAKLMILVGSPGIGKSAMVHALAAEMNLEVLTWNDAHHTAEFVDYRESHSMDAYLPYQSQMNSFEEFLSAGGVGMDSLELDVGDDDGDDSLMMKGGAKKEERQTQGSIILIEEIPNLYNAEAAQSFRNVMERHIQRTIVPTIFVYSDVYEGKHKPEELERLIPSTILNTNLVEILTIHPATKAKMKKCLQSIAKVEGIGTLTSDFCEEIHLSSGGDMRHAVLAMQFRFSSSSTRQQHVGKESTKRDTKLSMFHALGKLIHAKRKPLCQDTTEETKMWDDGRGPLEFDPEDILSRSGMAVGSAVSFLSYHCPDYFTDITEMSQAFDRFSDSDMFVSRFYQGGAGQSTLEYASSIASRAIADSNRTPAPPAFRQLSAPKVFGVMKKCSENEVKMDQLRKRLSLGGGKIALDSNIGSAHRFVTESLPHMRSILPEEVNYALSNLHSYANDSGNKNATDATTEEEALAKENEVLLEDDIVDDDDW